MIETGEAIPVKQPPRRFQLRKERKRTEPLKKWNNRRLLRLPRSRVLGVRQWFLSERKAEALGFAATIADYDVTRKDSFQLPRIDATLHALMQPALSLRLI